MIYLGVTGYRIIAISFVFILVGVFVLLYVLNKRTKKPDCAKPDKDKCAGCKLQDSCKIFKDEE